MLIFEYGILGLDPRFLGFGHGIENGGQFANGGDEGDLFEFAYGTQLPVELVDHRIAADGGAWSPDRVRHGSSGQAEAVHAAGLRRTVPAHPTPLSWPVDLRRARNSAPDTG